MDNGLHDPYLLLGPMGAAKVHKVFKLASGEPLIQKVLVMMYDIGSDLESESNEQAVQVTLITLMLKMLKLTILWIDYTPTEDCFL